MRDEGRPFEVGFQEQAPNHSKLLRSKAVGSVRWRLSPGYTSGRYESERRITLNLC